MKPLTCVMPEDLSNLFALNFTNIFLKCFRLSLSVEYKFSLSEMETVLSSTIVAGTTQAQLNHLLVFVN